MGNPTASMVTFAVGSISKALLALSSFQLKSACCKVDHVTQFLAVSQSRTRDRPLLTISNHLSTIDDPLIWGMLPFHQLSDASIVRWTLGADELMFKSHLFSKDDTPTVAINEKILENSQEAANSVTIIQKPLNLLERFSRLLWQLSARFFKAGQVIPVIRGRGLNQPGMVQAHQVLASKQWLHIFVEGKVNPLAPEILLPLRWGVAHLLLEYCRTNDKMPIVYPLILRGNFGNTCCMSLKVFKC